MAVLHQFDYIFALGMIFAFLDAWNIGANDVANSFATSVSSRSLTMKQAMMIATFTEFGGAVLAGARVADTIRSKILSVAAFEQEPAMLMLGMLCALVGSSTFLTVATRIGMPVSTTHCIVGGVIGVGVASLGADGVNWGWKGVSQVFAAWVIAPAIAGGFGIIIFLTAKYTVLERKNSLKWGLMTIPVWFGIAAGVLTMVIVWKGAPSLNLDTWGTAQILGCILGVGAAVALLSALFLVPYLYRKLVLDDWTIKPWHVILGPLLLRRGPVPERPEGEQRQVIQDYYSGYMTKTQLEEQGVSRARIDDIEVGHDNKDRIAVNGGNASVDDITQCGTAPGSPSGSMAKEKLIKDELPKTWCLTDHKPYYRPINAWRIANHYFFRGVNVDVVAEQKKDSVLAGNLDEMHAAVKHYDNKTEHLFSFLQVMTAATASFAHGSNDVSNAIGPLATIFLVWNTGELSSKAPVPIWVLVYGGAAIVIGLWTYGYNIMRMLGNRLTLHSPSRGFSMEFGSAVTVVLATRLALPVSTTQCITGATVGVGLCTGSLKAVNWRMIAWIYAGWIITLPCTGIISGCLMGIIINAPRWGMAV